MRGPSKRLLGALLFIMVWSGSALADEAADAESLKALRAEALEHYDAQRYVEAARGWEKLLVANPEDAQAKLALSTSLLHIGATEGLERAEALLVALIKPGPEDPTSKLSQVLVDDTLAAVLLARAVGLKGDQRVGKLRQAIEVWERVLVSSSRHPGALRGLVQANLALEQDEAAVEYAESYLELCQESQRRWRQQQDRWKAALQGQPATAEQLALFSQKIANARRMEVQMLHHLGAMHMRRNEAGKAAARYSAILELEPEDCKAHLGRARARAALGEFDAAVKDLDRCLELADVVADKEVRTQAAELRDRCRRTLREKAAGR